MTHLPSLDEQAHLADVFRRFPQGLDPLLAFHDQVLRGESELSVAERELIAAYVSSLNDCGFCFNAHRVYSAAFGIPTEHFDAIVADLDQAPIEPKLRELLKFVRKLTQHPSRVVAADTDALLSEGWGESAIHDAILVTGLFNLMNRIIFGHGLDAHDSAYKQRLEDVLDRPLEDRVAANESEIGSAPYRAFGESLRAVERENG